MARAISQFFMIIERASEITGTFQRLFIMWHYNLKECLCKCIYTFQIFSISASVSKGQMKNRTPARRTVIQRNDFSFLSPLMKIREIVRFA